MSFASIPPSVSASASQSAIEAAKIALTLSLQGLSALSDIPPQDISLQDFIDLWCTHAERAHRTSPVLSIEALDVVDRDNPLRQQTMGLCGHRFVIACVRVRQPDRQEGDAEHVYIRADLWATGQTIRLHRTRAALINEQSNTIMKLSSTHAATAPSLDAYVALLREIKKCVHGYSIIDNNCYWFTDRIMFIAGRKYADHWRSADGDVHPQALRAYIDGQMDEIDAGIAVGVPDQALRVISQAGMRVMKGAQAFFTSWLPREQQVRWPGDEVWEILNAWEPRTPVEV